MRTYTSIEGVLRVIGVTETEYMRAVETGIVKEIKPKKDGLYHVSTYYLNRFLPVLMHKDKTIKKRHKRLTEQARRSKKYVKMLEEIQK